ncbi:flagellar export protein FliJ [Litchfieldella xinjiangensis]|uniref:flagellar export protein FliJ n=1 Tax=Litchfieldella xinjiangensis TaxID=1166948 RepID=UPI0005BB1112|nr:flagellar export protein FliJ [Halomonas xinjiangensis]
MTQTQQRPLDILIDQARDARDTASQVLASERRSQQQVQTQLETLGQYRLEYAQRLQQAMFGGIDPATMQNYQAFLRSLDDALDRARKAVSEQQQRVSHSQQHWREQQQRLTSFDTLASRRNMQSMQLENRREMRRNDELASNTLLRQRDADTAGHGSIR